MAKTTAIIEVFQVKVEETVNYGMPATAFEIPENHKKEYVNEEAQTILAALPNVGMANRTLHELLFKMATAAKMTGEENWLKITVQHIK